MRRRAEATGKTEATQTIILSLLKEIPAPVRPYIHAVLRRFLVSDDLEEGRERYAHFIAEGLKNGRAWKRKYDERI